jgi:hypothetical protein
MIQIKAWAGQAGRLIQSHRKETMTIAALFIFVVAMGLMCAFNVTKNIEVVFDDNGDTQQASVETAKVTASLMTPVQDILSTQGVDLNEDYTVDTDVSKLAKDVDTVTVTKNAKGTIQVDGTQVVFNSGGKTVGDVLADSGVTVDKNDEVTPSVNTDMTTLITNITVVRVDVTEVSAQQAIPYSVQEQLDPNVLRGTQTVITPGVNGLENVVDQVTYRDGVESSRANIATAVIKAPVTQVVANGSKLANGGTLTTGNATEDPGSDMDLICAVVAQEGGHTYEGALAVISCIMNRVDTGKWGGNTAVSVIEAPGQFAAYLDGAYTKYMGAELPEVRQAVTDCMVGGMRSHNYLSFRSYETTGSVQIGSGNWFFNAKQ